MGDDLGRFELLDYGGDFTCDACGILYGNTGVRIILMAGENSVGNARVALVCKYCLLKLGIKIMERTLG